MLCTGLSFSEARNIRRTCTVNIWVQSEGIERALLPSEGIFTLNSKTLFDFRSIFSYYTRFSSAITAISGQKCHSLIALSFAWEMPFNSWKNSISESKGRFWVWGHWKGTFTCRRHIFLESKCRVWAWGQKIKTNSKS